MAPENGIGEVAIVLVAVVQREDRKRTIAAFAQALGNSIDGDDVEARVPLDWITAARKSGVTRKTRLGSNARGGSGSTWCSM